MKYLVRVTETLSQTFIVEADNEMDAESKMHNAYNNSEVVLDYDDFDGHDIEVLREATDGDKKFYNKLEVQE